MKKEARVHRLPTEDKSGIILKKEGKLEWNPNGNPIYGLNHLGWKYQHLYILSDEEIKEGDNVLVDLYPHGNPEWSLGKVVFIYESVVEVDLGWSTTQTKPIVDCRKIIATTDPKLHTNKIVEEDMHMYKKSLPQIPQSFIEEYCKAGGIDEVLVEYDVTPHESTGDIVNINGENEKVLRVHLSPLDNIWWFVYKTNEEELMHQCNVTITPKLDSNNCIVIHPVEKKMYSKGQVMALCMDAFRAGQQWVHDVNFTDNEPVNLNKWIEENL